MDESEKIYANPSQSATLRYAGRSIECYTLGEAVQAWTRLSEKDRKAATIKASDGTVYSGDQIDRLHVGPAPKK
jgi:hypothetical protein